MKRIVGLTIVAALLLAPGLADARAKCSSRLLVWSGASTPNGASFTNGVVPAASCAHGTLSTIDGRLIYGDTIRVRLAGPYIAKRPFVMAIANGLGFKREYIPLTWTPDNNSYLSGPIELPYGAQANGCLTTTVTLTERRGKRTVKTFRDSTTYHTAGVTC